jgi:DNA-binding HxlR family transcriptional regulator
MSSGNITRRHYDDACGTAHGLELLGERWAMLVVRELLLGPKRFSDLRADLPGISANVLTQRLEGLEAAGVVQRRRLPPPTPVQVYELTEWGSEAEPIVCELGRWAARSPGHDASLPLSSTSLMLSLRTMFDPARAGGAEARIGFRLGEETFVATIAEGRYASARGSAEGAGAIFAGSARPLAGAIYGGVPLDALISGGALAVEGDRALAVQFLTWFVLPPKAPAFAGRTRLAE